MGMPERTFWHLMDRAMICEMRYPIGFRDTIGSWGNHRRFPSMTDGKRSLTELERMRDLRSGKEAMALDDIEGLWRFMGEHCDGGKGTVVFTGAGVSTLSGIRDFRSQNGVYSAPFEGHQVEDILSLSMFRRDPSIFYRWAKEFCYCLDKYKPNLVHSVVARLESLGYTRGVLTQNIDVLHQAAGSKHVYEIHGSPSNHHCLKCGKAYGYSEIAPRVMRDEVPHCECGGIIKPDIVFYEEMLNEQVLETSFRMAEACQLMIVLGSSLTVQPAASIPLAAVQSGAKLCIVNAQDTPLDRFSTWRYFDLKSFSEAMMAFMDRSCSASE